MVCLRYQKFSRRGNLLWQTAWHNQIESSIMGHSGKSATEITRQDMIAYNGMVWRIHCRICEI